MGEVRAAPQPKMARRTVSQRGLEGRLDEQFENKHWVDTGCDFHPSCLTCPLVVCRYDLAGGLEAVRDLERRLLVRKLRARGATAQDIAGQVGCSTRTVWRLLDGFGRATVIPPPVLERAVAAMARVAQDEVDRLLSEVAKDHGVTVAAVKSPLRRTNLVAARDDAVRRMRYGLGMKLMAIARALNKRDHSTIIHSLRKGEG